MICQKCFKDFPENAWERGKTYKAIDIHHNPPEFISDFFREKWAGEFYNLCRDCHIELHKQIKKILFEHSNAMKFVNSEYWLMMKMNPNQIRESQKEIYEFTKNWIKEVNEDDSTSS